MSIANFDPRDMAQRIKHDREQRRQTQAQYGQELGGFSQSVISDLERGATREPPVALMDALRKRFPSLGAPVALTPPMQTNGVGPDLRELLLKIVKMLEALTAAVTRLERRKK